MQIKNRHILPAVMALILAQTSLAGVYKWVDKDGNVHFGDQPPVEAKQKSEIKATGKAPAVSAPVAPANLSEKDAEFRKRQIEKSEKEKKGAEAEKLKIEKEERCRKMKTSADEMSSGYRIYDYDKSGQRYYLDDSQRAKAVEDAKNNYNKECK